MKATEFLEEWNKTHTSPPSFQDAIDWDEKQHNIDTQEIQKQRLINKACKWLEYRSEYPFSDTIIEGFRKYMEK